MFYLHRELSTKNENKHKFAKLFRLYCNFIVYSPHALLLEIIMQLNLLRPLCKKKKNYKKKTKRFI